MWISNWKPLVMNSRIRLARRWSMGGPDYEQLLSEFSSVIYDLEGEP